MIIKDSLWVEDRTRTGDIQNHNLTLNYIHHVCVSLTRCKDRYNLLICKY